VVNDGAGDGADDGDSDGDGDGANGDSAGRQRAHSSCLCLFMFVVGG